LKLINDGKIDQIDINLIKSLKSRKLVEEKQENYFIITKGAGYKEKKIDY
jgi:hypothetical protein